MTEHHTSNAQQAFGGVDTHADTHHVAVIDSHGRRLDDLQVPATAAAYQAALLFLTPPTRCVSCQAIPLLSEQIKDLTGHLTRLLNDHAPALMGVYGAGPDTVAQLLITAGDNPDRLRSERHFAALAGVSPIPASSGKTTRHRLNRGGDRQANSALYHIILVRMRYDEHTRDYVTRRTAQAMSKKEIIRCLKRYLARQLFPLIQDTLTPRNLFFKF